MGGKAICELCMVRQVLWSSSDMCKMHAYLWALWEAAYRNCTAEFGFSEGHAGLAFVFSAGKIQKRAANLNTR
jgi:hypothetical protein